jgi:putative transcriptional regulator
MDNNIRVLRAERNITQEELANALDVSRQTIIAIENGKYDPSLKLVFKISKYFGKNIEDIFKIEEE